MTLAGLSHAIVIGGYLGVILSVAALVLLLTLADVWLLFLLVRCLHSRFSTSRSRDLTLKIPVSLSPARPETCSSTGPSI